MADKPRRGCELMNDADACAETKAAQAHGMRTPRHAKAKRKTLRPVNLDRPAVIHRKKRVRCHEPGTLLKNRRQVSANRLRLQSRLDSGRSPSMPRDVDVNSNPMRDAMAKKAKKAKKTAKKTTKKAKKAKKK